MTFHGEFKIVSLRETSTQPEFGHEPQHVADYFNQHVRAAAWFDRDKECLVGLTLNTRLRITGMYLVALGTLDTIYIQPREVFRPAIVAAAKSIVICHNHPSGDPTPSAADIKVTRQLAKAGELLQVELTDHIVIGEPGLTRGWFSLKEAGYFY